MGKRDTRTPEQILADLKARAAAKIEEDDHLIIIGEANNPDGPFMSDEDFNEILNGLQHEIDKADREIERLKRGKTITADDIESFPLTPERQAFFASQPFTNTAVDDDFDEAEYEAAQDKMRAQFRGKMVEVKVNEHSPLVDNILTLGIDDFADYDDGDDHE